MDTDSFVIHIKTENLYEDIADDVEKWFDKSNYDEHDKRTLPIDELGRKIMGEFAALRAKTYSYLLYDDAEHKKAKGTKKCIIKRELMFKKL